MSEFEKLYERLQFGLTTGTDLGMFIPAFATAAILSLLLGVYYYHAAWERKGVKSFAQQLMPFALGMMVISAVVSSSIALAVGLVGALSIIRFRAVLHSVEMLCFLFMAIAIGIAAGMGQAVIAVLSMVVIVVLMVLQNKVLFPKESHYALRVEGEAGNGTLIIEAMKKCIPEIQVMQFHSRAKKETWVFDLKGITEKQIQLIKVSLRKDQPSLKIVLEDASQKASE